MHNKCDERTDAQTHGHTDGRTGVKQYAPPPTKSRGGIKSGQHNIIFIKLQWMGGLP